MVEEHWEELLARYSSIPSLLIFLEIESWDSCSFLEEQLFSILSPFGNRETARDYTKNVYDQIVSFVLETLKINPRALHHDRI